MPIQKRARGEDDGDLFEPLLQTDFLGLGGESWALVVVEPGLFVHWLLEDFDLLLEVLITFCWLRLIQPARQMRMN